MTREAEWRPEDVPACGRCGGVHRKEWATRLEGEGWVFDGCLTPEEMSTYRHREEQPKGKVELPRIGKQ